MKELFVEMSILSDAQMEMVFGGSKHATSVAPADTVTIGPDEVPL